MFNTELGAILKMRSEYIYNRMEISMATKVTPIGGNCMLLKNTAAIQLDIWLVLQMEISMSQVDERHPHNLTTVPRHRINDWPWKCHLDLN